MSVNKPGHFEICEEMAKRGMDIRMSLLENVTNLRYSERTTRRHDSGIGRVHRKGQERRGFNTLSWKELTEGRDQLRSVHGE